ncbi:MAG: glycosyltransferase [Aggregatilineales bacterium]
MNLMMLSGDNSIARGTDGAFYRMLAMFSQHWSRIDILTPSAPDASARLIHGNVYVHPSPWHRLMQPHFIKTHGAKLLQERDYALVTSHDFGFFYNGIGAYWLLKNTDIPYVSEIHHVEGYPRAVTVREKLWRFTAMRYLPFVAKHAAAIRVVNAIEVPQLLREIGIPDEKILVLPSLYMDFEIFKPLPDIEKQYGVLFVGRLAANKGILILLDAIAKVRRTHPEITLAIRGDGDLKTQIDEFITEHDLSQNIRFLPRVSDDDALTRLYNQANMLVCASTVEGGPRVTVEAMACGIPVISTPVGIMPEVIQHGENGFLFEWDSDALAAYIIQMLDDPLLQEKIAAAGRMAVQDYDAKTVIGNYACGYHALIHQLNTDEST